MSIGLICGVVGKNVLSKIVYGLGGTSGVGKNVGIGCTNSTLGKTLGIDTAQDSMSNLFLGSFSFISCSNSS